MNLNNLGFVVKQAQKMSEDIKKAQAELENIYVTGSAGGGMVEVTANCRNQIINIRIEPEIKETGDLEMLEDLVLAAVNQALKNSQERASEHMSHITGGFMDILPEGIKIPGIDT